MKTLLIIFIGLFLNALCLIHFYRKGGFTLSRTQIILTLLALIAPYIGALIYYVWYLWQPPPPPPEHLKLDNLHQNNSSEFLSSHSDNEHVSNKIKNKPLRAAHKAILLIASLSLIILGIVGPNEPKFKVLDRAGGFIEVGPSAIPFVIGIALVFYVYISRK